MIDGGRLLYRFARGGKGFRLVGPGVRREEIDHQTNSESRSKEDQDHRERLCAIAGCTVGRIEPAGHELRNANATDAA